MKNKIVNYLIVFLALIVGFSIQGFSDGQDMDFATSATNYRYTFQGDTITDTEIDTLTIPVLLLSQWSGHWAMDVEELSGTGNLKFVIDENDYNSGNARGWVAIDSVTLSDIWDDNLDYGRLTTGSVNGVRQRVRVVGTGTQSTKYNIKAIYKKP